MATQLQFAARLNIQADGANKVQSQIDGLEKELVEAVNAGDKVTQQWLKSMINVAKVTKEVVASLEKIGNAHIGIDPAFVTSFQTGIQKAVEQGVINGLNAGKKSAQTASTAAQTATQSASGTPNDTNAQQSLTASITRLDSSIVAFANALNRQNALAGGNVRSSISQATGRPQFDIFQEVSEVALREQGKELRSVATDIVRFLGEGERVLNQKREDVKSLVQNLSTKLDINSIASEAILESIDLGESLGSSQADIISQEIFSSIGQKFSVQLLSDTDALFKVFHGAFQKLQAQGYKGQSVLLDEQGKWLSETEAGQRLMVRMASRFLQSKIPLGQLSPEVFEATSSVKSPSQGPFDLQTDFLDRLQGAGAEEAKETLDIVMQLFKSYEEIELTKKSLSDLEKQTKENSTGALQNLERMLALNRDQFALAKQNNLTSSRYTNILQQNNALLAQAPKAVSYAILEGDLTQLIALQREYSHQVQRATNLNKDLEVQANRQRNLAAAYAKDAANGMTATIEKYGQLSLAISGVTAKLIAQDAARKASGGSPQFGVALSNVSEAASGIQGLLGGDVKSLIDSMLGGNFEPQMAARLIEVLKTAISAAAINPEVGQAFAPLMQQLAQGMSQFAQGAGSVEGISADEAAQLNETANALKLMADRAAEAANNQYKFSEASKQTVKQQTLLEQQTTAVAKILQTLRSETRISEEGLRIVEKQLRKLNTLDFKLNSLLVSRESIDGLTKTESLIERIQGIGGIFDQNAIEEVKSHSKALKELRDQLVGAKFDIEAARVAQIGRINKEAARARQGAADSEFSGILPENLEIEITNRLAATNKRFDEMSDKIVSDLGMAEKAFTEFTDKTQPLIRQGERISSAYRSIDDISSRMQNLTLQSALLSRVKIVDSLDLTVVAGQYNQLGQDIDTVARKNRELRAQLVGIAGELNAARSRAMGPGGSGEDLIYLKQLEDKYEDINKQLIYSEQLERKLVAQKNSSIAQETILQSKRLDAARQMASAVRDFDVQDSSTIISQLQKDLKSLNVDVLARANNEFKSLRSNISSALIQAQKSLSAFQAQAKRAPLSVDDQASVGMLEGRIKELQQLSDATSKMEVASKSADARLKEQVLTFQEYGQNLRQMIKGQVDFAIGTGVITAGFAALGTAFREVLSEARAVSRAITVLQSNLLTTTQITDFTYEKTRKLAVQYGMTVGAVADIAKELGSAGFKLQEVSRGWEATLRAINATNADATTVTRAVSGIYAVYRDELAAAGKETEAFGIITNTLTSIFQNHQAEMDEIVQGYKFVVGTGKVAGFSFQQMGAYLAVLNDNMIKSGMAGRSLQVVFAQMAAKTSEISQAFGINLDPSKTVAEQFNQVLEQMHERIGNAEISAGELNQIFKLFDKQGARAFATLVQQYPSVKKALNELEFGAEGVTAKMNDIINNSLDRKFYQMKQAALDFAREGFDAIKPALIEILTLMKAFFRMINDLNKATNGIASTTIAFVGLSFAIYKAVYAMIALSASIGGSFFADITKMVTGLGNAMLGLAAKSSAAARSITGIGAATTAVAGGGMGAAMAAMAVAAVKVAAVVGVIVGVLWAINKAIEHISGGTSLWTGIVENAKKLWDNTLGAIYESYTRVDRLTEGLDKSVAELARLRKEAADFKTIIEQVPDIINKIQTGRLQGVVGAERLQKMIVDAGGDVSKRFTDITFMSTEELAEKLNDITFAAELQARLDKESHDFRMKNLKEQKKQQDDNIKAQAGLLQERLKSNPNSRNALAFALDANQSIGGASTGLKSIQEYNAQLDAIIKKKGLIASYDTQEAKNLRAMIKLIEESQAAGGNAENALLQIAANDIEEFKKLYGSLRASGLAPDQVAKDKNLQNLVGQILGTSDPNEIAKYMDKLIAKLKPVIAKKLSLLNPEPAAIATSLVNFPDDMATKLNYQGSPANVAMQYQQIIDFEFKLADNKKAIEQRLKELKTGTMEEVIAIAERDPVTITTSVEFATKAIQQLSSAMTSSLTNLDTPAQEIERLTQYFEMIKKDAPAIAPMVDELMQLRKNLSLADSDEERKIIIDDIRRLSEVIAGAAVNADGFNSIAEKLAGTLSSAFKGTSLERSLRSQLENFKGFSGRTQDTMSFNASAFMTGASALGLNAGEVEKMLSTEDARNKLAEKRVALQKQQDALMQSNIYRTSESNALLRKQYDLASLISKRTANVNTNFLKVRDTLKSIAPATGALRDIMDDMDRLSKSGSERERFDAMLKLRQELSRFGIVDESSLAGRKDDEEITDGQGNKMNVATAKQYLQILGQINDMTKEDSQLGSQIIVKNREINYQKETETNAYREKLMLMTKEIMFYSEFSAAQSRLNNIQIQRTDGLIREMRINRELVANTKTRIDNASDLSAYLDAEYKSAQERLALAKNEKEEAKIINSVMASMQKNTGSMLKLAQETSNEFKNMRAQAQKFADENVMAIETIGAAQTLLFGSDSAAAKAIQSVFTIYSRLPSLDLNTDQINEVTDRYKAMMEMAETTTQQVGIQAEYEDNMIFLLNRRVKLLGDIQKANKEITKQIKEQLVEDRRPELYKEIAEAAKRMQEPLRAAGEKQIEDMFSRDAIETTKALVAVTGDDFYWAIENNKEAMKQFFLAVENGKGSFDKLSSSITRTLKPQILAYQEMLKYEKMLMKAQIERAQKAGGVLSKAVVEGDFSRANSQFSTIQSSILEAVKLSGNERDVQAVSKKLIDINSTMLDAEAFQSDMLLQQLKLSNTYLASIEGLIKEEATDILEQMSGFVGDFSSEEAIKAALDGTLSLRRSDIETLQVETMQRLNSRLTQLTNVLDKFARNLNLPNTLDPTAGIKGATIAVASAAELASMKTVNKEQTEKVKAIAKEASEKQRARELNQQAIRDQQRLISVQAAARGVYADEIDRQVSELLALANVATDTRRRVEDLTSELESNLRRTNALNEVEQKYGATILELKASINPLYKLLINFPDIIASATSSLFSMFSGLGNLDYAAQNAEALVNYQKQLVQVTDTYNSSIENTTTALRRNETEFYDYINAIQDAERQRAKELLDAQKTYRESLMQTSQVMKEQFLTPGANAIGSGLGSITSGLQGKSMELFGSSLKSLAFNLAAGPQATEQGSNFLNNIAKSAGGILAGVGGTIATTAISGFATVAGQVFDAIMGDNADKLLEFVNRLASEIPSAVRGITTQFVELFPDIMDTLVSDVLPALVDTLVTELPIILSTVLQTFANTLPKFVSVITNGLTKAITPLTEALLEGVLALVPALIEAMPDVLAMIPALVTKALVVILRNLPQLIMTVLFAGIAMLLMPVDILTSVIGSFIGIKIPSLMKAVMSAGEKVISAMPKFHSGGVVPGVGEKPAMLLGGEGVLNKKAMAMLGKQNLDLLNKGYQPQMREWTMPRGMTRSFERPMSNTTNMGGLNVTINGVRDADEVPELLVDTIERRLVKRKQNRESRL